MNSFDFAQNYFTATAVNMTPVRFFDDICKLGGEWGMENGELRVQNCLMVKLLQR